MIDQKGIVKAYVRYLKLQRNMSGNTLDAYQRDLRKLLDYLEHEQLAISDVTLADLEHFSASLHDIGIHPRSQCRILSGIRSFFKFVQLDGYREDDPTELLESPQIGDHLPEVLTTQEVDRLEESIDLLRKAGLVYPVKASACDTIPLGGSEKSANKKLIVFDTGVYLTECDLDTGAMLATTVFEELNKGDVVEMQTGLELIKYANAYKEAALYYWYRTGANAEVDYVIEKDSVIGISCDGSEAEVLPMELVVMPD